jgi:hypothetical protein
MVYWYSFLLTLSKKERHNHQMFYVTCLWAGMDSVWNQKKLKAMLDEMLENAKNHRRQVRTLMGGDKLQVVQISTQLGFK